MDDSMKKIDLELKKRKVLEWFKERKKDAQKFYYDNEETIRKFGPVAVPAVGFAVRSVIKGHNIRKEQKIRDTYHWDPKRGTYYISRRPLTMSEQLELDRLYSEGYTKGEALKRMKLLK